MLDQDKGRAGVKVRKGILGLGLVLFESRLLDAILNISQQCEVAKKGSAIEVALMKA